MEEIESLKCPTCENEIGLIDMLKSIYCFGGEAIVFDCPACRVKQYFYPRSGYVELGSLGCSPVIDPIPLYKYYANIEFKRQGHEITIEHGELVINVPSSIKRNEGVATTYSHKYKP